jgi:hypothetical protein
MGNFRSNTERKESKDNYQMVSKEFRRWKQKNLSERRITSANTPKKQKVEKGKNKNLIRKFLEEG